MATKERVRVAIVGAGIGGLSLSSALDFMDHDQILDVNIYEASSSISEIGAGINFWPRTWEIMKEIGLQDRLLEYLPRAPDNSDRLVFQVRKGDQPNGVHIQDLTMKGGPIRFHRADLQKALMSRLSGQLFLSHRLESYEESQDEVHLYFENGLRASCDILVGMDGIKSVVRKQFSEKHGQADSPSYNPVWSGEIAYRALIPMGELHSVFPNHRALKDPVLYCGKSKHLVIYPISQDKFVNVVAFVADPSKEGTVYDGPMSSTCSQEELLSAFSGWEPEVLALLKCAIKPTKWAVQTLRPLERYSYGRTIIGGDAAHAMAPHQGAAAGQAIEDGYILASLMTNRRCSKAAIAKISEIFNDIRRPAANKVAKGSRDSGRMCQLISPGFEDVVEGDAEIPMEKLVALVQAFYQDWDWVWKESAEIDRMKAIEMLMRD